MVAPRLDLSTLAPKVYKAMLALDAAAGEGLEAPLKELVRVRASQLNGCAYCDLPDTAWINPPAPQTEDHEQEPITAAA